MSRHITGGFFLHADIVCMVQHAERMHGYGRCVARGVNDSFGLLFVPKDPSVQ